MSDIKDLTVQELQDKLGEERQNLNKLRFDHTVSPLDNPMQLRYKKKDIARLLTELRMREQNEAAKA